MRNNSTLKFVRFLNWCDYWRYRGVKGIFVNDSHKFIWAIGTGTCKSWVMNAVNDNKAKS